MDSRITIYGKAGDKATEILRREMRAMDLDANFKDVIKNPDAFAHLKSNEGGAADELVLPKVSVACAHHEGSVTLTNPDLTTLRQTLYAEEVLGITSYWI